MATEESEKEREYCRRRARPTAQTEKKRSCELFSCGGGGTEKKDTSHNLTLIIGGKIALIFEKRSPGYQGSSSVDHHGHERVRVLDHLRAGGQDLPADLGQAEPSQ